MASISSVLKLVIFFVIIAVLTFLVYLIFVKTNSTEHFEEGGDEGQEETSLNSGESKGGKRHTSERDRRVREKREYEMRLYVMKLFETLMKRAATDKEIDTYSGMSTENDVLEAVINDYKLGPASASNKGDTSEGGRQGGDEHGNKKTMKDAKKEAMDGVSMSERTERNASEYDSKHDAEHESENEAKNGAKDIGENNTAETVVAMAQTIKRSKESNESNELQEEEENVFSKLVDERNQNRQEITPVQDKHPYGGSEANINIRSDGTEHVPVTSSGAMMGASMNEVEAFDGGGDYYYAGYAGPMPLRPTTRGWETISGGGDKVCLNRQEVVRRIERMVREAGRLYQMVGAN